MKKFGKTPNFPLKCFTNPTLQGFKNPLFTAFFLIVHILSCENRYSPPIFISTSNGQFLSKSTMGFRYTCVVFFS